MAYQSKRAIASMIAGVAVIVAYLVFAMGEGAPATDDLSAWALALLIVIGIGIVVAIVIQILFHIFFSIGIAIKKQDCSDEEVERTVNATFKEDEMDKTISLKSSRSVLICVGVGLLAMLVSLVFGMSTLVAIHIIVGATAVGSLVSGVSEIYYYERGVY